MREAFIPIREFHPATLQVKGTPPLFFFRAEALTQGLVFARRSLGDLSTPELNASAFETPLMTAERNSFHQPFPASRHGTPHPHPETGCFQIQ